jgi:hypothetical protein
MLRRMCIVLLLDEIICSCLSGPLGLWCHLILDDLSISDSGVLKSPTIIVLGTICAFKSHSVCLMKLGIQTLGTYVLTNVIYS